MRPLRFSFHPLFLALFGLASGALALGASSLRYEIYRGHASRELSPRSVGSNRPEAPRATLVAGAAASPTAAAPRPVPAAGQASFRPASPPSSAAVATIHGPVNEAPPVSPIPAIANNQILAFYGKPDSKSMGIVGEYPKEELAGLLEAYARLYDAQNGELGVVPAFYLIYGTCWPGGEIGYLKESIVTEYIDFARSKGYLVFLDHQIGKYTVGEAMGRLLPWLKYPNVHIALDPEWRTDSPMQQIGSVSADEINAAEAQMSVYLGAEGILGQKMLVIHQFQSRMIPDRERIRADFEGVLLIHTSDGFGPPALKRSSYSFNTKAENMPLKGFKLFFKTEVEGAGYDDPLLLPAEVLALDPCPRLIIYQ